MSTNGHAPTPARRVAAYSRVSTGEQTPENQLVALRAYIAARGWQATEYVDHGVSGARDRRPGLDALMAAARARKVGAVIVVRLDRLARSVRHLTALAGEFEALGVDLIVLEPTLDTTTPSGQLTFHVLGAVAQFERELIRERVRSGLQRVRAQGKRLGRPRKYVITAEQARAALVATGGRQRAAARRLGVPIESFRRAARLSQNPVAEGLVTPRPVTPADGVLEAV